MISTSKLAARLDEAVRSHRLLDHPFYRAWADGTLSLDDLSHYAGQYWRQVEAFPGYLDVLGERLPHDRARAVVASNLADERGDDHAGLWLRFAEAVGVSKDAVLASEAEAETTACVDSFAEAMRNRSKEFALGMLYGYESQTPEVAATKAVGLREHYGIDGPAVAYFELHGELDVHHSAELAEAIVASAATETDLDDAEAGAVAGARAVEQLLDGVARVRGIG